MSTEFTFKYFNSPGMTCRYQLNLNYTLEEIKKHVKYLKSESNPLGQLTSI